MKNTRTRFARLMKARGWTQRDLAKKMGCSPTYVSMVMRNIRTGNFRQPKFRERLARLESRG